MTVTEAILWMRKFRKKEKYEEQVGLCLSLEEFPALEPFRSLLTVNTDREQRTTMRIFLGQQKEGKG